MTIQEAAKSLYDAVRAASWFTTVGIGEYKEEPCLYLYVNSLKIPELRKYKKGWEGYHVEVKKMQTPYPISPRRF